MDGAFYTPPSHPCKPERIGWAFSGYGGCNMRPTRGSAPTPARRRIPLWIVLVGLVGSLAAAGVTLALVPAGQLALVPHAPIDLGDRIRIDGRSPEPLHGRLFLVGVEERPVSLLQKLYLSFDDSVSFEPAPTAAGRQIEQRRNEQAIASSKEVATAVALELLGLPVDYKGAGATVTHTFADTPGGRVLRPGDRIVRLDERPVVTSFDVTRYIGGLAPGTKVRLGVRRDGRPAVIELATIAPVEADAGMRSRIGVSLSTPRLEIRPSRKVSFETEEVTGPSAGLAFALAAYDSMSDADVLRGRHVVATGALALDGTVVPVASVREKAIAAQTAGRDLMIVPTDNVDDAVRGVQAACQRGRSCTRVLGVRSVRAAVDALQLDASRLEPLLAS